MKIIDNFIKQYNKEFDFYQELSKIVSNSIEDRLIRRGIKAIVTHRAKRPDSLREKLIKRNNEKSYKSKEEILEDIVDLAGVRVSLYFPSERDLIDEIVNDLFTVDKKKLFPDRAHTPKYEKRFSGYWATHYRIRLKDDASNKRYLDTLVEIQVASVLMHAWSEVEHDLVYKPFSGNLSKDELAILDEINGLVLSGEIALERLHKAISERTSQKKEIADKYELTNYLMNALSKNSLTKLKLGDTFLLNNYINSIKKLAPNDINNYMKKINLNVNEPISDQLFNMVLIDNYEVGHDLKHYFYNLFESARKASGFESYVRCWVLLEKAAREIMNSANMKQKKYVIPDFSVFKDLKILSADEAAELNELRRIRNYLVHGIETPSDDYLKKRFISLKKITKKVIVAVKDEDKQKSFQNELTKL